MNIPSENSKPARRGQEKGERDPTAQSRLTLVTDFDMKVETHTNIVYLQITEGYMSSTI